MGGVAGYLANIRKVIAAVEETEGLVMTYNGRLIDAVYHSCCGGMTEDAAAVWEGGSLSCSGELRVSAKLWSSER